MTCGFEWGSLAGRLTRCVMPRRLPSPSDFVVPLLLAGLALAVPASAQTSVEIPVLATPSPRVRVDGWLVEWGSEGFGRVGADPAGRARVALAPADRGLYIAVSVDDDHIVRTGRPSEAEDAIVVTFGVPDAEGAVRATDIWLYAGVVDQTAASLSIGGPGNAGAAPRESSIVEMPTRDGYDLEAFVPWSALPGRDYARAHVGVRLHDADRPGAAPRDIASVTPWPADASALPRVTGTAGELFPLTTFLRQRNARLADVEVDLRANFVGSPVEERLVAVNGVFAVFGTAFAGGRNFAYAEIGDGRGSITDAHLVDVEGDGVSEFLCVATTQEGSLRIRELRIFRFAGERISPVFRAEIGLTVGDVGASSVYHVEGRPPTIRIDASTTPPPSRTGHVPEPEAEPILLASSGIVARTYAFSGGDFRMTGETRAPEAAPAHAAPTGPSGPSVPTAPGGRPPAPAAPPALASGTPRTAGFDPTGLLAGVRRDHDIAETVQPRFVTEADIVEDARPEQIAVLGRTLVVVGPGYRGGVGYFALDIGAPSDDAIVGLSAADVTGDGKAEIWLRVRQPIGTPPLQLELLVIYRMANESITPLLTAQIALTDGTRTVRNEPRVVGSGRSVALAIAPGTPQGYDARTFPFRTTATPGMATLLLPWRDSEQRYRWNGTVLAP